VKKILDELKPGERVCSLTGEKWMMTEEEIEWYKKFNVPPIKLSPNTLWKWMAYFDCGFQFWWNKHYDTGKSVLSFHHPATGVRVLPDVEWHSRDFSTINSEHNPSQSFFLQLRELQKRIPLLASFNVEKPENSITLLSFGDRNSYFVFGCSSERSYYCAGAGNTSDSSLVWLSEYIQKSHHVLHCQRLFACKYASESLNCMNSSFIFDCRNCKNCFGATNKRNREFVFFNEQLTKDEYETRLSKIDLGKRSELEAWKKKFEALMLTQTIQPESFNVSSEQSQGEYLTNATRCDLCFYSQDMPSDNFHSAWLWGKSEVNAHDWGALDDSETYMCVTSPHSHKSKFCYRSIRVDECEFCYMCIDCRDCFGCVGIRHKRFCILNKQYDEAEYYHQLDEIKTKMLETGEYGNYLPVEMSTSYVPENGSAVYCGSTDEELNKIGGNKFDPNDEGATGFEKIDKSKIRDRADVPDSIEDLTDEWVGVPIYDDVSKRTFAFLKPELEHYRELRIAPPNTHFIRRLHEVATSGQLCEFVNKTCSRCSKNLLISKNKKYPDRKIFCTQCYLRYIEQYG
jgi:hypothetical protein